MSILAKQPIQYPDSDGEPMAENTLQWQWIVTVKENLDSQYRDDPHVFVAGDLLWYPVEGEPTIRMAPDTLVAFGRPKGHRGSYRQWVEGGITPQVVFEILSPGNRAGEMVRKFDFYENYGVEEYYVYDPDDFTLSGWLRGDGRLREIPEMNGWVSPRLGIRFDVSGGELVLYHPNGERFLTFGELVQKQDELTQRIAEEKRRADEEKQAREQAQQRADEAERRAAQLAERLRAMGIDPNGS